MNSVHDIVKAAKASPEFWEETARLEFAVMLNEAMDSQGLNKAQLAEKTGISHRYITKILSGDAETLTLKGMSKLLFALGQHVCLTSSAVSEKKPVREATVPQLVAM